MSELDSFHLDILNQILDGVFEEFGIEIPEELALKRSGMFLFAHKDSDDYVNDVVKLIKLMLKSEEFTKVEDAYSEISKCLTEDEKLYDMISEREKALGDGVPLGYVKREERMKAENKSVYERIQHLTESFKYYIDVANLENDYKDLNEKYVEELLNSNEFKDLTETIKILKGEK